MPRDWRTWVAFLAMGVLNNLIPFSLIFWGQTRIGAGMAAILNATTPLWAVFVAHLLTRDERLTANRLGGALLGLAGVAVMIGPAAFGGLNRDALAQIAGTTLLMAPIALVVNRPWLTPPTNGATWGAIVGLALLCTALAYVIYFRILAAAGATNLMLVTLLIPVSALLLGRLLLDETIDPRQLIGMSLIGLGLIAIDGRLVTRLRRLVTSEPGEPRPALSQPER